MTIEEKAYVDSDPGGPFREVLPLGGASFLLIGKDAVVYDAGARRVTKRLRGFSERHFSFGAPPSRMFNPFTRQVVESSVDRASWRPGSPSLSGDGRWLVQAVPRRDDASRERPLLYSHDLEIWNVDEERRVFTVAVPFYDSDGHYTGRCAFFPGTSALFFEHEAGGYGNPSGVLDVESLLQTPPKKVGDVSLVQDLGRAVTFFEGAWPGAPLVSDARGARMFGPTSPGRAVARWSVARRRRIRLLEKSRPGEQLEHLALTDDGAQLLRCSVRDATGDAGRATLATLLGTEDGAVRLRIKLNEGDAESRPPERRHSLHPAGRYLLHAAGPRARLLDLDVVAGRYRGALQSVRRADCARSWTARSSFDDVALLPDGRHALLIEGSEVRLHVLDDDAPRIAWRAREAVLGWAMSADGHLALVDGAGGVSLLALGGYSASRSAHASQRVWAPQLVSAFRRGAAAAAAVLR